MAGWLSGNLHILGKTIPTFKFLIVNRLALLTGTVLSPQFKCKWINNSDFTQEEVVNIAKKELEYRYRTMSTIL